MKLYRRKLLQLFFEFLIKTKMADQHLLKEKVIKGSFIVLILAFLGSVSAYLIRILLSRTLTVEDYGLFYAVFGLISIITAYIDLGFGYSVVYLFPKEIKIKNYAKAWNIFVYGQSISLTMALVAAIIFIIMAPFLAQKYFKIPQSEPLIYIFSIYLISFTVINGLIQVFTGLQREKYYSSITISRWLLTLIISFLFFTLGFSNVIYYAIALCAGHILTALIYFFLLLKKYTFLIKHKIAWEKSVLKQMFSFAFPSLLETVIVSLAVLADTFFLTLFKGVREVGAYNIIYPLASIPLVLLNPINGLLLPLVSHLMEGEREVLKHLLEKILRIVPFIWLYFALFTILFPSAIAGLIFGPKWIGLVEVPVTILSLGILAVLMNGILGAITLGTGKVQEKLKMATITAIISIILSGFFIYNFGVLGAVITASIMAFTMNFLFSRIIRSVISFRIPYSFYFKLLIFSVIIYSLVKITGIYPKNWPEFIAFGFIYSIIYVYFGYLLKVYDQKLILMILPKIRE